jgi:ubiquinone/menaquinone biosynthesis C-methylase UbiE
MMRPQPMKKKPVDLYDSHYGRIAEDVFQAIRAETYGEDLGQTSWLTAEECDALWQWLDLGAGASVLEVACGSGGVSTRLAERFDARVVGVDINQAGVDAATAQARAMGVADRAEFRRVDADEPLPFPSNTFDVVFCNDAINHLRDRAAALRDWHRVLRPGGFCLYTDPIVVTGCLSNEEMMVRSSIGFFLFVPVGENERLLEGAGFTVERVEDLTASVSATSKRWHDARARRQDQLMAIEGSDTYEDLQRFLSTVHRLSAEGRLSRFAYLTRK